MIMTSIKVGNAIAKSWETEFMKFSIGNRRIYCVHSPETKQTEAKQQLQELKDSIEDTLQTSLTWIIVLPEEDEEKV